MCEREYAGDRAIPFDKGMQRTCAEMHAPEYMPNQLYEKMSRSPGSRRTDPKRRQTGR